ncbi:MAG: hypothetical protein IK108_10105 [Clostridia bacterium]|nr:hypothetical protein [Clostridia bacterium]
MNSTLCTPINGCIYLDSSNIIRRINKNSRHSLVNYFQLKDNSIIEQFAETNSCFYKQIIALINKRIIERVITYEAIDSCISTMPDRIIQLFLSENNQEKLNTFIYLNQEVNHSVFYRAAESIVSAQRVLVDPLFFDFQVGRYLTNYIKTSCQVISLGKNVTLQKYYNEITVLKESPEEFIEKLFSVVE